MKNQVLPSASYVMLSINMNHNMGFFHGKSYVLIHVIKHDMDPNSNINYRRKIGPVSITCPKVCPPLTQSTYGRQAEAASLYPCLINPSGQAISYSSFSQAWYHHQSLVGFTTLSNFVTHAWKANPHILTPFMSRICIHACTFCA